MVAPRTNPLTLRRSQWVCVLDPSLLLSPYGLPIIKGLGEVIELWVVRELWHILDNTQFYLHHPESIQPGIAAIPANNIPVAQPEISQVLQSLEQWRINTEPSRLNLHWIGDRPCESCLPTNVNPQLEHNWEILVSSLDQQLTDQSISVTGLDAASRDTVALAAALNSAFILTYQVPEKLLTNNPPNLCLTLESWGIACHQVDVANPVASLEREYLLHLLISVGAAKFLWSGLNLAILHIVAPALVIPSSMDCAADQQSQINSTQFQLNHLRQRVQGFWYWL